MSIEKLHFDAADSCGAPEGSATPSDTPLPPALAPLASLPRTSGWRTPMQGEAWLRTAYDTLYTAGDAALVTTEGGLAPFVKKPGLPTSLWLATMHELGEPLEPLVADEHAADRLAQALLDRNQPIRFGHVPADGLFTQAFVRAASTRGRLMATTAGGSPVLFLDDSWRDPMARFSSRRRSDFRRMERRAEAIGPVATEFHTPTPEEVPALFERACAVEAKSWKTRSHTALRDLPKQADFLLAYGQRMAAKGGLQIAFLTIGGMTAGMQIMVEDMGALWLLKIGYDEEFAKVSPGMLLLRAAVKNAADKGLERVEFLGKEAEWTKFWTTDLRPHMRLRYYPAGLAGVLAQARDVVEHLTHRAAKKLAALRDRRAA